MDSTVRNNFWLLTAGGITYKEARMDRGLEQMNAVMRTISTQKNIPLFDAAKLIPKSLRYFYDDCHFNNTGAAYTGTLLAEFLYEEILNTSF